MRAWRRTDAAILAAILDDAEIARWTAVTRPYSAERAARWLARPARKRDGPHRARLALVDRASGAVTGGVELAVTSRHHGIGEVSYFVGARYRGRGLATAAVELLADWAFGQIGLERLELLAHPDNAASHRVAVRSGFGRVGLIPAARRLGDRRVDLVLYSRVRREM